MNTSLIKNLFFLLSIFFFLIGIDCYAIEIFVWERDNGYTQQDPVFEEDFTASMALTRTLEELDYEFTADTTLPENLGIYDVVLVTMGFLSTT